MSARARIWAIVGVVAVAAAAATVALVAATSDDPDARATPEPPPLYYDFGLRDDAQTRALRRATRLYEQGDRGAALELFSRYSSPEARVGAAFASWPDTLARLRALPQRAAVVRLHEGIALAAAGDERRARRELRAATRVEPDTPYAVRADDFLHPRFAPGLPLFVPAEPFPRALAGRPPRDQLALLAHLRTTSGRLHYGAALQRLGMPVSARHVFDAAVRLDRGSPEPLAAAAVARFDKDDPSQAFGRLGPLSRRFPRAQTIPFHLGVLLLWLGDVQGARVQLEKARRLAPSTRLGREAKRFLDRL